jgi:sugar diacid utilization regulator
MICEDIIGMEGLEGLNLVAGKRGLDRPLKWIYFADAMECLGSCIVKNSESLGEWINGGELLVITNERLTRNADGLKNLMSDAYKLEVAGIVINTGQISPMIEGYANELGLPLFELLWSLKLVNLSQIVCKAILMEESNETSLDQILANLLYNGYDSENNLAYQAMHFGFDLHRSCRIAFFDLDSFSQYVKRNNTSEGKFGMIKKDLQNTVKQQFRKCGIRKVMSLIQSDSVTVLLPSDILSDNALRTCICEIQKRFSNLHDGLTVSVGIGNPYSLISEFSKSLNEAVKAEKLSSIIKETNNVMFFRDLGMLTIYSQIENEKALWDFYQMVLGKLESVDEINKGDLLHTLKAYIECNKNAAETANELFIHRNTLRYRLNKIEEILGVSLDNLKECVDISNAFQAKHYLEIIGIKR